MPDTIFRHNRTTGLVEPVTETGYGPGIPFSSLTNGRVGLSGNSLINLENHTIIDSLGRTGETYFVQMDNGNIDVQSGVSANTLNAPGRRGGEYGIAGQVTVNDQSGNETAFLIEFASVARIGKRLVFNPTGPPGKQYTYVDASFTNNAELQARVNADIRFATPTEARDYALMGYLQRHYEAEIKTIVAAGGLPGQLEQDVTFSGVLAAIAEVGSIDLNYVHQSVLNLIGDIRYG